MLVTEITCCSFFLLNLIVAALEISKYSKITVFENFSQTSPYMRDKKKNVCTYICGHVFLWFYTWSQKRTECVRVGICVVYHLFMYRQTSICVSACTWCVLTVSQLIQVLSPSALRCNNGYKPTYTRLQIISVDKQRSSHRTASQLYATVCFIACEGVDLWWLCVYVFKMMCLSCQGLLWSPLSSHGRWLLLVNLQFTV